MRFPSITRLACELINLDVVEEMLGLRSFYCRLFGTYSVLIGKTERRKKGRGKTRLDQLIEWCGASYDGVIVFDESHRARTLYPSKGKTISTKTGLAVQGLQERLPSARIIYTSATGKIFCCS